jgi:endonuclease/exonuclease/phosphatase family metal-dependent hydrolase
MKICQYNIYFGNYPGINIDDRMKSVCQCILNQNADVVCLQEVVRNIYDLIVILLSEKYPYMYPDDGLMCTYGTVIFSRYPIINAATHHFEFTSMGRDIKLAAITDNNLNTYYICTSHFESEFRDGCTKKIYQYNRCADILYQIYQKSKNPIIMCADTNVCPLSERNFHEAFSYAKGWRDTWVENGSSKTNEFTFDSYTNPILIKNASKHKYISRLDRIMHLSNMHTNEFKIFGNDRDKILSDHYGIVCTFSDMKPIDRGDYIPPVISNTDRQKSKCNSGQLIKNYDTKQIKKSTVPSKKLF